MINMCPKKVPKKLLILLRSWLNFRDIHEGFKAWTLQASQMPNPPDSSAWLKYAEMMENTWIELNSLVTLVIYYVLYLVIYYI